MDERRFVVRDAKGMFYGTGGGVPCALTIDEAEKIVRALELVGSVVRAPYRILECVDPSELERLRKEEAYLRWRLEEIMPLLEEARDALPAIKETARKSHGIRKDLATRMDMAGTRTRDDFDTAMRAEKGDADV